MSTISKTSRFLDPIDSGVLRLGGYGRGWGEASILTKWRVMEEIAVQGNNAGFSNEEIAFALAVARTESGFNPDAAAKTTSASGIGQFIDRTGKAFGLDETNRFDMKANVKGMLSFLKECLHLAKRKLGVQDSRTKKGESGIVASRTDIQRLAYAFYHDGPSLNYEGATIADQSVIPWVSKFLKLFSSDR